MEKILQGSLQTKDGSAQQNLFAVTTIEMQSEQSKLSNNVSPVVIAAPTDTNNGFSDVRVVTAITSPNQDNRLSVSLTGQKLTYSAPAAATVGVASAQAVAANASRRYLLVVNTSVNTISLAVGQAAVLNSGITLMPNGGAYEWCDANGNLTTGEIRAIAGAAASNLAIQEAT